jgi:hypothetical protein
MRGRLVIIPSSLPGPWTSHDEALALTLRNFNGAGDISLRHFVRGGELGWTQ